MQHCKENNISNINPTTFPLFSNDTIHRKLSPEGIDAVVQNMINAGTFHPMSFIDEGFFVAHYFAILRGQITSHNGSNFCRECGMGEWTFGQVLKSFFESSRYLG